MYAKVQEKHDFVDREAAAQQKKDGAADVGSQNIMIKMLIIYNAWWLFFLLWFRFNVSTVLLL